MEIVGVVLGGIPLVLWALDNYRKALNPAKDYWRYESTLNNIHMNIFIQKEQLGVTFHNMGLQGVTLAEIELNLRRRYPDKCDTFMDILGHMDDIVHKLMDKLCIDIEGKISWLIIYHRLLLYLIICDCHEALQPNRALGAIR